MKRVQTSAEGTPVIAAECDYRISFRDCRNWSMVEMRQERKEGDGCDVMEQSGGERDVLVCRRKSG